MCNYAADVTSYTHVRRNHTDILAGSKPEVYDVTAQQRDLWFRVAVISVPILGFLILVILVVMATRMLSVDRRQRQLRHHNCCYHGQLLLSKPDRSLLASGKVFAIVTSSGVRTEKTMTMAVVPELRTLPHCTCLHCTAHCMAGRYCEESAYDAKVKSVASSEGYKNRPNNLTAANKQGYEKFVPTADVIQGHGSWKDCGLDTV
jgi:hypothetical protein